MSTSKITRGLLTVAAAATVFSFSVSVFAGSGLKGTRQQPVPKSVTMTSWEDNGRDGQYLLQFERGRILAKGERIEGIIVSDTNCIPDAQGLNHCNNVIELANGSRLLIVDNHKMSSNPCLHPGSGITLTGMGGPWIKGTLPQG